MSAPVTKCRFVAEEAPYSAQRILEKLREMGFDGGYSIVEDFAGFYGFKPILCRPYRGQTKGKVERTLTIQKDTYQNPQNRST